MEIIQAQRLKQLPPYLFAQIDRMKQDVKAQGADIIDLGIGDPDQPTPEHIIEKVAQALEAMGKITATPVTRAWQHSAKQWRSGTASVSM